MDLIGTLASTVGIGEDQAKALAGTVLGGVQDAVGEDAGEDAAGEFAGAIPELDGWKSAAASAMGGDDKGGGGLGGMLGGGGGAGGLLGMAAGAIGGEKAKDAAALAGILSKFNIDADKAALVAPVVLNFLKDRLPEGLLDKALAVAPMLTGGGGGGGAAGMLSGALGGMFGKD